MNCDQIKEKMDECLKNDIDNRECKEIIDSWKLECDKSSWLGDIFSSSDEVDEKEEPEEVSKEKSEEVLKEPLEEVRRSIRRRH